MLLEATLVNQNSTADAKIRLFRSLFRGRDDVYPRRFESRKTGKSGYAPACGNEWIRGICEKPRIKCADCQHQRFLPITDEVIRWHLSGFDPAGQPFVAGIYPMLQDETCFFLAVDFDKEGWLEDAGAFLKTSRAMGMPAVLERSRSGHGGHAWFFFEEAITAASARRLGSFVLTESMERRPDLGFGSYDRFFPNQDTLPHGGFGNLIALPLQKEPRDLSNSVFLDDQMVPYGDQWAFLSSVTRIGRTTIEDLVRDAERRGRVVGVRLPLMEEDDTEPWTAPPSRRRKEPPIAGDVPDALELVVANEIYIARDGLPPGLRNRLLRLAAFQNPEFYKAQAMRLPTYDKPRIIACAEDDDCIGDYGQVIVDECHHLSAHSFEQVIRRAKARFVTGLSATITRKDGHHPIIFMLCGPVRHRVNAKAEAMRRPFTHSVLVRPTAFQPAMPPPSDKRVEFHSLYGDLIGDESRNRRICEDVVEAVEAGRSPLVLTERKEHLESLANQLAGRVDHVIVLRGGMGKKQREAMAAELAAVSTEKGRVILATGRYIGEGFDDARLDTLFLTLPVSWHGTIAQYAGRLHRLYDGKREVRIYDYADLNVPMLARMFDRRCRGYEAVGYSISLPASAVPGWPADVVLPSDPEWKRDYAATVRRLIRDGVDTPLANLFVRAVKPSLPEARGVERARSASEAFLYRRLETLPETKSLFQLNVGLPIAFDGQSQMEVDFLNEPLRIVVELDGSQHLSDPEAYRRDRRKDRLLQQNGYLILRFLAEDLGKDLDGVLDSILQSLAGRERSRFNIIRATRS